MNQDAVNAPGCNAGQSATMPIPFQPSAPFRAQQEFAMAQPAPANPDPVPVAKKLFAEAWAELEKSIARATMAFPKEVIWLNGAPGAGKGTNTPTILKCRKITAQPVVTSDLLNTPEAQAIKAAGGLVGDKEVIGILLRKLLEPAYANGVVVDGFPRTRVQAECVKLFFAKLQGLSRQLKKPKPSFHLCILFVEEKEAVERQLGRGTKIAAANEEVKRTGQGQLQELRPTDVEPDAARKRYRVFCEQSLDALKSLSGAFPYHQIDAKGDIPTVEKNIIKEFSY
jgi:adenylate kinase